MKRILNLGVLAGLLTGFSLQADVFTIATYTFNEANSFRDGFIVEGPHNLPFYRNDEFTKRAVLDIVVDTESNEPKRVFKYFDRTRTFGYLLGHPNQQGIAMGVSFPEKETAPPMPNVDSSTIEFTWGSSDLRDIAGYDGGPDLYEKLHSASGAAMREELLNKPNAGRSAPAPMIAAEDGKSLLTNDRSLNKEERGRKNHIIGWGLPNKPGPDFVIFETGTYEGFSVAVRKAGSKTFTYPRYQFANFFDAIHNVNAVGYDISDFGLADDDVIVAVRIRNIFNSYSRHGADRVDSPRGEGRVLYPGDPGYENSYTLLSEPGGVEFSVSQLDADLLYGVGLHDIVPVQEDIEK